MKKAIITGSEGFVGKYLRQELESNGYEVIGIDLIAGINTLVADLLNPEQVNEIIQSEKPDCVFHLAGQANVGKSWEIPLEAEETMVRLNDETLMSLTKLFLNDFIARGEGTIVNVASTGAFQPGPYIAGYYASKAFVLNYTKALAEETRGTGVHVCCLCPGPVDTHFYMKSGGKKPRFVMSAEKTARIAYEKIQKGKTVIVPGLINNLVRVLPLSMRIAYVKKTKLKNLNRKTKR